MSSRRRQLRELALLARISEEERREDTWEQVLNGLTATVTPIRSNRIETTNRYGPFNVSSDEEAEDIRSVDTQYYDSEQVEIVQETEVAPVQLFETQTNEDGPAPEPAPVPIIDAPANSEATEQALLLFTDDEDRMFKYKSGYLLQKIREQNPKYAVIASPSRTNITDLQKWCAKALGVITCRRSPGG